MIILITLLKSSTFKEESIKDKSAYLTLCLKVMEKQSTLMTAIIKVAGLMESSTGRVNFYGVMDLAMKETM